MGANWSLLMFSLKCRHLRLRGSRAKANYSESAISAILDANPSSSNAVRDSMVEIAARRSEVGE
jgi:hypothetical protein